MDQNKRKEIVWGNLLQGSGNYTDNTDSYTQELLDRFSDVMVCRMFGWTRQELQDTPSYFVDDIKHILSKENGYHKAEMEKAKRRR